jgi:GTP-binding protein HflX
MDELERLVKTLGYESVARITQSRHHLEHSAVVGEGKLKELGELTGGPGVVGSTAPKRKDKARLRREGDDEDRVQEDEDEDEDVRNRDAKIDLVAVDHDITPSQLRNLERATGTSVLDRTGVIIEIFHRHAKSREARLQVEIARLTYTAPRLRESPGGGKERQRGRGAGEAALELDRRKIRDRIAELREELARIQREQDVRRRHRKDARRVALIGYTNAGKSSLMRALTGSDVYVENKLFATLDTTIRALRLDACAEAKPRILVSDTVGFIKKLPHDLVASFKSTLDEAHEASLLLHVVDAADSSWDSQLDVTREVLAEIGAGDLEARVVFNKIDLIKQKELARLQGQFPDAWFVSAHRPDSVRWLHDRIIVFFESSYEEDELVIPYDRQAVLSEMHDNGRVVDEKWDDTGVTVTWRAEPGTIARIKNKLAPSA